MGLYTTRYSCTLHHTQLSRTSGNANRKEPGEKQENRNKKRTKPGRATDQQAISTQHDESGQTENRVTTKKKTTNAMTRIMQKKNYNSVA
jgi:hypothetical protein